MKIGIRTWILIIAVILALLAIKPSFQSGALIKSVDADSQAFEQGLRQGQIIKQINEKEISSFEDYGEIISSLFPSQEERRIDFVTDQGSFILFTNSSPEIVVQDVPSTNIKTGLDIRGGARALIQPEETLTDTQLQDLIEISQNRFNIFGISDVQIKPVRDLSGNQFMLVEVAGATPTDLEELVSKQGKFEAKIKNQTVFIGGERDIVDVCRNDATCAAITSCFQVEGGYACNFQFSVFLSAEAAKRHADITAGIPLDSTGQYLQEDLFLFLDDVEVDSLKISSGLKGRETTQISIQGSGQGATQEEAFRNTQSDMNHLQTVLITGSLPFKLNIVKLDTISPLLGDEFIYLILLGGFSAILAVGVVILIRYRNFKSSILLLSISLSEIVIILGVASFINWNLDLPSIAGILATIGTGIDDQIVIMDEARTGKETSIKERMKRALFVVMTAYLTSMVALLPLYWAGAGLFKGFAITSIIGITAGVFISRPAFAEIIRKIEDKK